MTIAQGPATGRRPIRRLRWYIGGLLFLSTVINYIDRQTLSVLAPFLQDEYQWSNTDDMIKHWCFVLPIDVWSRHRLRGEVESVLLDRSLCASCGLDAGATSRLWRAFRAGAPGLYWSRVWALFALLWWSKEHRVAV